MNLQFHNLTVKNTFHLSEAKINNIDKDKKKGLMGFEPPSIELSIPSQGSANAIMTIVLPHLVK